ncbi:MAG: DNA polymerase III subunit gamma/tau [Clostridia bacterium]|nr:DNA polymerase III subunit gamma/tau [Clostridia bacterium]
MSEYQVLYRKWRPKIFDDVCGQPQVTVTLKNELKSGRIAHAFLFTGSRGTGKTSCAKILAKAVNCLHPIDGEPCNKCEICLGIDNESVLDVVEMDAASNNGVDDIRDLRDELTYTPAVAKYRVFIIDEVHMLSVNAFNALLKTLEEPPPYAVFILATTDVHKLPQTIISRCQRFDFNRIAPEEICKRLLFVAQQEDITLDGEAAMLIARIADGGMRDALSLLDQCIGVSRTVTEEVVGTVAGMAGKNYLFDIAEAVCSGDTSALLETVDALNTSSKDMSRLCAELVGHFRNLLVQKTVQKAQKLLAVTSAENQKLHEQAQRFTLQQLLHAISALTEAQDKMARGGNRRTELELCLIKLCKPELDTSPEALLRRISDIENKIKNGGILAAGDMRSLLTNANTSQEASQPAPADDASATSLCDDAMPIDRWQDVLSLLHERSLPLYSALRSSQGYINENCVFVDCTKTGRERLRSSSSRVFLKNALHEILGGDYRLGPYTPGKKAAAGSQDEESPIDRLARLAGSAGFTVDE